MKFDSKSLALAASITSGIVYIICAVSLFLAPDFTYTVANYIFHGMDLSKTAEPIFFGGVMGGLALTVIFSYAIAYSFSEIYNYLNMDDK